MSQTDQQFYLNAVNGEVLVTERTLDALPDKFVRVRVTHSAISPGTELSGLQSTAGKATGEAMGYQVAGVVEAACPTLKNQFKAGDRVACYGGPYVCHGSRLNVPRHLACKLPDGVGAEEAAFCALGSIALHGFRNGQVSIGETVAVIGLGLLGNLTAQIALAAGCNVVACEALPRRAEAASAVGIETTGSLDVLTERIAEVTSSHGADAVFLATGNCNDKLLLNAFELVRRLGNVVILGLAEAQLPRSTMFSKEARLVVSRAAGWGRYDVSYERDGHDYPYEHARWTEGRNLQEVIRLMGLGRLKLKPLITDRVYYQDAALAYRALAENPGSHLGTVLEWEV